jgi:hypothetical protein
MGRILLLACLTLALVPPAAQAQQVAPISPFFGGARTDVNDGGQAVVAWASPRGVRAVIGDRTTGFGAVAILSSASDTAAAPQVAIDAAGDAIVVWEIKRTLPGSGCSTCGPRTVTNGVFASLRPAGGDFGAPVQVAGAGRDTGAEFQLDDPKLAMSSTGHAVIAWSDFDGAGAALRAPGSAIGAPQRVAPAGFAVNSAAIGGDGSALLGSRAGGVLIRPAGGAFGTPQPLPGAAQFDGRYVYLAANTAGDALAAYYGDAVLLLSRRPAGGDWGAPAVVDAPTGSGLHSAVLSDGGAGAALYVKSFDPRTGRHNVLFTALSPAAGGPLGLEAASRDDLDADAAFDASGLDTDAAGDVVVAFDRFDFSDLLFGRHVAQLAVRTSGGAFGAPVTLTAPEATGHASVDTADAAIDARGDVLATWADHHPGQIRLLARWFTVDGAGAATLLDAGTVGESPFPAPARPHGHYASVLVQTGVTPSAHGRVPVRLSCVSFDRRACTGMLSLRYGKHKRRAGRARFTIAAGRLKRVYVTLDRRSRRTLARKRTLNLIATALTSKPGGALSRSSEEVFVTARRGGR